MQNLNTKSKYISLTTYAQEKDISRILEEKSEQLDYAFYIHHDKDNNEPHYHIVIGLKTDRTIKDIVGWFKKCIDLTGNTVNTFGESVISCEGITEYLTHSGTGQEGKHQYIDTDIKAPKGSLDDFRKLKTERDISLLAKAKKEEKAVECESLIDDIIIGKPLREMAKKYGRDFMKNRKQYCEFASLVVLEEEGDFEKAFKIMGNGLDQHIEEVKHLATREAYAEGEYKTAAAICHLLQSEVDSGATYLQKTLDIMNIYKKGIYNK